MSSFKKNDLVVVNPASRDCKECTKSAVMMYRALSRNELLSWYMSASSGELDSAGEPKIAPEYSRTECEPGTFMVVSKARAKVPFRFSSSRWKNMCELLDMNTGELLWTSRENVKLV
jgi:hypothetical protein